MPASSAKAAKLRVTRRAKVRQALWVDVIETPGEKVMFVGTPLMTFILRQINPIIFAGHKQIKHPCCNIFTSTAAFQSENIRG
jgi:hypothetical protein